MGLGRREGGRAPNWPLSREQGGREDESGGPPNLRCVRGPRSIHWLVLPVMAREPAIVLREECEIKGFVAAVVPLYIRTPLVLRNVQNIPRKGDGLMRRTQSP